MVLVTNNKANKKDHKAIGFYEWLGCCITKKLPNYCGDGETRYLFEKHVG
ncbi:MAG: hypothetical protein QW292_05055 [Candidatus Parvarchaeota archaeon]